MKLGLDGKVVFDDYLEYKADKILEAFEGNNNSFPIHPIKYELIPATRFNPKKIHNVNTDSSVNGNGIYLYRRQDSIDRIRSFMYCGVTTKVGIRQRFVKVAKHAKGDINIGDNVIPLSKYLHNECKGDIDDIEVCFVPLEGSVEEMKTIEKLLIKKLKNKYGSIVKNVSDGESAPRKRIVNGSSHVLPI